MSATGIRVARKVDAEVDELVRLLPAPPAAAEDIVIICRRFDGAKKAIEGDEEFSLATKLQHTSSTCTLAICTSNQCFPGQP